MTGDQSGRIRRFLTWGFSTPAGHVVVVFLPFTLVEALTFLMRDYGGGALTMSRALLIFLICAMAGCVLTVLFWFGITRTLLKRRNLRRQSGQQ